MLDVVEEVVLDGVEVVVNVEEVVTLVHIEESMLLVSIVTAAVCARALPDTLAPVFNVMLASARIFPANAVVVPSVAELPTCQNTLHGFPPLIITTEELLAVVSVLPIWKIKSAFGLPCALRVSGPVSLAEEVKQ